ncbi:MAG TPA: tetratricopeptide repeat protein [Gemmataceae bacterium]
MRQLQQRHPNDFWVNHELAFCLHRLRSPRLEEAIRFYTAAIALRPQSPGAHNNLGNALYDNGRLDEAIAEYREALRINKDFAEVRCNLANPLHDKGLLDEAIAEHREAIRIKKDYAKAHNNLGNALRAKGQVDEAIDEYREAIRIKKDFAQAHTNLGIVLGDKGQLDEAITEYRTAIQLKKDDALAHFGLGLALYAKGRPDEAIAAYREAIRINKDYPEAHCNLGIILQGQGEFRQAVEEPRLGHELGSKKTRWPYPSAQWVRNCERLAELDDKLPAILSGQKQPADTTERLALAQLCQMPCKKCYADALRFYSAAFDEEPKLADDLNAHHRYNVACAAALAGCGQGKDADQLDSKESAHLRQQALDCAPRATRSRPQLEVLEDRWLPSHMPVPTTLTVTNNADSGAGSLRAEIAAANPGDTIDLSAISGQTINLSSGELLLNKNLTIQVAAGDKPVTILGFALILAGSANSRVFDIDGALTTVALNNLNISDGDGVGGGVFGDGGAIWNAGKLTLTDCNLSNNTTVQGEVGTTAAPSTTPAP